MEGGWENRSTAYNRLSKPINRLQTEAAKTWITIENARQLQASWDRSLMIRVPLLSVSMLAQTIALSAYWGAGIC